jgi:hypothetical protein
MISFKGDAGWPIPHAQALSSGLAVVRVLQSDDLILLMLIERERARGAVGAVRPEFGAEDEPADLCALRVEKDHAGRPEPSLGQFPRQLLPVDHGCGNPLRVGDGEHEPSVRLDHIEPLHVDFREALPLTLGHSCDGEQRDNKRDRRGYSVRLEKPNLAFEVLDCHGIASGPT